MRDLSGPSLLGMLALPENREQNFPNVFGHGWHWGVAVGGGKGLWLLMEVSVPERGRG